MKKRRLEWNDIKSVVQFKTFYIVVTLVLIGIVLILVDRYYYMDRTDALFKGILTSLGITFITSSTVSIIMEVFLRLDIVDFMSERMIRVLPSSIKGNTGVREFHRDRKNIDFKMFWSESKDFIKIIGVSSNDILASANFPIIKQKLKENDSFTVQVLLLAPWSFTAEVRATAKVYKSHNEGILKTYTVITELRNFFEHLRNENINPDRILLRLYDDIPSLSMVIDAKSAIVAPFMVVEFGGSSPYFIADNIDIDNSLYNMYIDHFDTIWNASIDIKEDTNLNDIYNQQIEKDMEIITKFPKSYNDWVVSVNTVVKR